MKLGDLTSNLFAKSLASNRTKNHRFMRWFFVFGIFYKGIASFHYVALAMTCLLCDAVTYVIANGAKRCPTSLRGTKQSRWVTAWCVALGYFSTRGLLRRRTSSSQ
jgi:hypothetical protein